MRIAQILNNRVHWVFEAAAMPNWPPDPEGNRIVLVDVTGKDAHEGDGYNPITQETVPFPVPEERDGYAATVTWDAEAFVFTVEYTEVPADHNEGAPQGQEKMLLLHGE